MNGFTDRTSIILDGVERRRIRADRELQPAMRSKLGQFMTPAPIAQFMASLFAPIAGEALLLDPGAGIGTLASAFVERAVTDRLSAAIDVRAYEVDQVMRRHLSVTMGECSEACRRANIGFHWQMHARDFINAGVELLRDEHTLFASTLQQFTHCIMNPPYRKINSTSSTRTQLQQIGIETTNLYTGFMAVAVKLLAPGGELVAIVPRSFCNGVYFRAFRTFFLSEMSLRQIHIFEARNEAFRDNAVLQENIIVYAVKDRRRPSVVLTSSANGDLDDTTHREVSYDEVVKPDDADCFINIAANPADSLVIERLSVFTHTLDDLGVTVSTGPVVDFRLKDDLRPSPEPGTFPLIYPAHLRYNTVCWPKLDGPKPNAIAASSQSLNWLMPNAWYVLVRRFSAKEEKRRIVASVYDPNRAPGSKVGFENHLNVLHIRGAGMPPDLVRGLAIYLNSTLVDRSFRQFSGHTQVNANDLRTLRYPDMTTLLRWGSLFNGDFPDQREIDALLEAEISTMSKMVLADDTSERLMHFDGENFLGPY
jgi:adenine-specific DNA-methyltransferase